MTCSIGRTIYPREGGTPSLCRRLAARRFTVRIIGLFLVDLMLGSCTYPIFPTRVMKDAETDSFDVKAWKDQAYHSSHKPFVPHKVELGGVILQVSHKPDGVVILAEEQPLDEHLVSSPIRLELENAPWFAITFQGAVEPRVLQTGNRLVVIGMMNRARPKLFEGAQRMLPHLTARCLHIWNTEEVKNMYVCTEDTTTAGRYPADECTFCLKENATGAVPNTNGKDTVSGGL